MMERVDVAIVGGGVIGSAIAFNLLSIEPSASVLVVERDPTYRTASSALSASSIRQQFSTPVNMALSRYSMAFLKDIGAYLSVDGETPDVNLVERGYLYLASEAGRSVLETNHAVQREYGVDVELLNPAQMRERFPWLSITGLSLGSLGLSGEGWFDGYGLLQAFRRKARAMGAVYVANEVVALDLDDGVVTAITLKDGTRVACGNAVNAAGPQAEAIANMAGLALPVRPEKHCIFVFDCKDPPAEAPLIIDPSGVYCRPEGRFFIAGAPREEDGDSEKTLDVDHQLFDEVVWPALATRVPAFETIKLTNSWAGYYETNIFDHNAILGTSLQIPNLYFANGFSGHGMQQAPAVGRGLAELILFGEYRTLDLRPLSFERVLENRPLRELNVI